MAAKVVSFINLKGGVGKTTLALGIGEFLAFWGLGQKVLLVDMDGQSNLSYALLPTQRLEGEIWPQEKSIYHMFKAALDNKDWDIEQAIIKDCSNIRGNTNLHTIVCSPDLGQLDEDILVRLEKGEKIQGDFRIVLGEQLKKIKDRYDWVIIDCPPSLSTLTSNAILCSDYWVAPLVPEALSLLGINLIQTRIRGLADRYKGRVNIKFAGSILNRIDIRRKDHIREAEGVYEQSNWFQPFQRWVGDWKPLYLVSDYAYPFENWGVKWVSVDENMVVMKKEEIRQAHVLAENLDLIRLSIFVKLFGSSLLNSKGDAREISEKGVVNGREKTQEKKTRRTGKGRDSESSYKGVPRGAGGSKVILPPHC